MDLWLRAMLLFDIEYYLRDVWVTLPIPFTNTTNAAATLFLYIYLRDNFSNSREEAISMTLLILFLYFYGIDQYYIISEFEKTYGLVIILFFWKYLGVMEIIEWIQSKV